MIRYRQIKVPIKKDTDNYLINKISHSLKINKNNITGYKIIKKSIDARDKDNIHYVYDLDIEINNEDKFLKKNNNPNIIKTPIEEYNFEINGDKLLKDKIVIVGSGPAGLFCAYLLTEAGYKTILIERGEKVEDRVETVNHFFETNELNEESNIQFGEGGAGTFSDGKLNTLVKDKKFRGKKVFEIFVENGAPKEILYLSKPHIGTDILRKVIINMRNKILRMGGEILYKTKLTNIIIDNNKVVEIEVNNEKIVPCSVLVLAIGHSARDTFHMLHEKGLLMKAKNFAVGVRIEHPQEMINKSQYKRFADILPPASYKLTYQASNNRGVYSFCMCPGGYVINASSQKGHLAVNGMSNSKRDGSNANSAIVVTVKKEDFNDDIFAGLKFQEELEKKAYELGKGFIPIQLLKDYLNNKESTRLGEVIPSTKGKYTLSNLQKIFPSYINDSLMEAFPYFGTKISGFDRDDAIVLGVESRTSSPIIIERNIMGVSNIEGIYPCGEGAGYAGGITTSAMDGIKIAEEIANLYKPN